MVGAPSLPGSQAGDRDCDPQIDSYEKLYEEVSRRESTKVFHGWLQCDCRPFNQALLNTIKRWSLMFKRHLSNHVISRWAPTPGGTSHTTFHRSARCRPAPPPGQARG